jgi:hypothetical protein
MRNKKVLKLEQAINTLEYAKLQIKEALGDTDAYHMSANQIDDLIEDINVDIEYLAQSRYQRG